MTFTKDEARFWGTANRVAERDFSATFDEDRENCLLHQLYAEFKEANVETSPEIWLTPRLSEVFQCVGDRPLWVGGNPEWPFHRGKAMTFISQIQIGETRLANERLSSNTRLFVFGIREQEDEGWTMKYHVVEQLEELG